MVDAQDLMIDQALHDVEAAPAGEQATSTASQRRQPWRSSQMTGPLSARRKDEGGEEQEDDAEDRAQEPKSDGRRRE